VAYPRCEDCSYLSCADSTTGNYLLNAGSYDTYAKFMIAVQLNPLQEPRHPPIRGCGGTARR
jgi:hypothetical protein